MKNSELVKQILINCNLPSDMNELDSSIFSFLDTPQKPEPYLTTEETELKELIHTCNLNNWDSTTRDLEKHLKSFTLYHVEKLLVSLEEKNIIHLNDENCFWGVK